MNDIINLNNNYYIKVVNKNNEIPFESMNIKNLKLTKLLKKQKIIFQVDFNEFSTKEYKKILKKILLVKNVTMKMKKKLGLDEDKKTIVAYIINFNEKNVAINDKESLESESFTNNLLDYPNYTKPKVYRGLEVPPILLSGDHAKIKEYRMQEQIKKTKEKRPDLITKE